MISTLLVLVMIVEYSRRYIYLYDVSKLVRYLCGTENYNFESYADRSRKATLSVVVQSNDRLIFNNLVIIYGTIGLFTAIQKSKIVFCVLIRLMFFVI